MIASVRSPPRRWKYVPSPAPHRVSRPRYIPGLGRTWTLGPGYKRMCKVDATSNRCERSEHTPVRTYPHPSHDVVKLDLVPPAPSSAPYLVVLGGLGGPIRRLQSSPAPTKPHPKSNMTQKSNISQTGVTACGPRMQPACASPRGGALPPVPSPLPDQVSREPRRIASHDGGPTTRRQDQWEAEFIDRR